MSEENEAYAQGARLLRELHELVRLVETIDASDTACKEQALAALREARQKLKDGLRLLAGLV